MEIHLNDIVIHRCSVLTAQTMLRADMQLGELLQNGFASGFIDEKGFSIIRVRRIILLTNAYF